MSHSFSQHLEKCAASLRDAITLLEQVRLFVANAEAQHRILSLASQAETDGNTELAQARREAAAELLLHPETGNSAPAETPRRRGRPAKATDAKPV